MKTLSRVALLSALSVTALGGCNLTYDREGVEFDEGTPPPVAQDVEPNDTTVTALPLTLGTPVTGQVGSDADLDYYAFTVPPGAGQDIRFMTWDAAGTGCASMDPELRVFDSGGALMAVNDDTAAWLCSDLVLTLAPGDYYVQVSHSDAASTFGGPYGYRLTTTPYPTGQSWTTASCDFPTGAPYGGDYCEELSGTLDLVELARFESDYCRYYGGIPTVGPCPTAGRLLGYCDDGASGYGTTNSIWYYEAAAWIPTEAAAHCASYAWVGWVGPLVCSAPTPDSCTLGTRPSFCTDLASDTSNCGSCGTVCEPGSTCTGTGCSLPCGTTAGYAVCGTTEYPVCVDTLNDPAHCGGCGPTTCDSCVGGQCGTFAVGSCDTIATLGFCNQLTGTFTAAESAAANLECTSAGGTVIAGSCPAGSVPGYCDAGTPPAYPGATSAVYFYAPTYSSSSAQTSCATSMHTWIPGPLPTVAPLLPLNGANWNDWVQGRDWSEATLLNSACVPDATAECVHAGELLEVSGNTQPACTAGLTATDALGAFDWICDGSTNPIRFVSTGLKRGVRLRDLIDDSTLSWRPNSVTIWDAGVSVVTTSAAQWWANPIAAVPASNHLDAPGTIYVADGTQPGPISIDVSRVALVGPASPAIVTTTSGTTVVTADTSAAPAGPRDFLWIEGRYKPEGQHGIQLAGVRRSVVRNVELNRSTATPSVVGLWLYVASHNRVEDFISVGNPYSLYLDSATDNRVDGALLEYCSEYGIFFQYGVRNVLNRVTARHGAVGVMLFGSRDNVLTDFQVSNFQTGVGLLSRFGPPPDPPATGNRFSNLAIAANSGDGLVLDGADANRFSGVVTSNNGAHGVHLLNSDGNALVDALTVNNGGDGMLLEGSSNNRLIGITSARNLGAGVTFARSTAAPAGSSSNNLLESALSYLNHDGVRFADVTMNGLVDVAVSGNYWYGLTSEGASQTGLAGELRVGTNTQANCSVTSAGAGFLAPDCAPEPPASYLLAPIPPLMPTTTFVAAAVSDAANTSGGAPVSLTDMDAPTMDWTRFERPHRAWSRTDGSQGPLGCSSPLYRTQPACIGTWSGAGTIFDWSLLLGGGQVVGVLAAPVPGTEITVQWTDATQTTFLPHAWEILGDALGNDDGLCEPALTEACLWTPNFGAYQGHGLLSGPSPTGGANVHHYLTNGY